MAQKTKEIILKEKVSEGGEIEFEKYDQSTLLYIHSKNSKDQADTLISDAIKLKASDIHIQPFKDKTEIRFRIKGKMSDGLFINYEQ